MQKECGDYSSSSGAKSQVDMKIAKLEKLYGMDEEEKQAFDIEYQKEIKMNPMFVQQ